MNTREPWTLIIMGNGPSLAKTDWDLLKTRDTFGLNAAYRGYNREDLGTVGFCPTYYGCFDYVVSASHMAAFYGLMEEPSEIQQFFWITPALQHPRSYLIDLKRSGEPRHLARRLDDFHDLGNSGANAAQIGVCLDYRRIILVGVDCKYVEELSGTVRDGHIIEMVETPEKNPNYWFDDYQRAGDRFNAPRTDIFQRPGWERFAELAKKEGIDVINCSPDSQLECFERASLADALGVKQKRRKAKAPKSKTPKAPKSKKRNKPEEAPADPLGLLE